MEEDSRWLAQTEKNWQKKTIDSLSNNSATSVYEDANSTGGKNDDDLVAPKKDHTYSEWIMILSLLDDSCFLSIV